MSGSEVTGQRLQQLFTTFCSGFHLWLHSYKSGFVVLFQCYQSGKHETYRYSVQLGKLGIGQTIFWVAFVDFIVVLA